MMMAKQPPQQSSHQNHPEPNTVGWYFFEFWPVMVFGSCFVLMMAIPLCLSGAFAAGDYYSQASVWAPYGLLIIGAFLMAWLVTFIAPWAMGAYVFLLGVYALIMVENVTAMNWGWMLAVLFLAFMVLGNLIFGNIYIDATQSDDANKPPR
ncbi:MAG: hypothetical protein VKJ04_02795 [Vampirovibrionales bacterium]|nr:hypothetical protein [Vampirovibrionales bacterium]